MKLFEFLQIILERQGHEKGTFFCCPEFTLQHLPSVVLLALLEGLNVSQAEASSSKREKVREGEIVPWDQIVHLRRLACVTQQISC